MRRVGARRRFCQRRRRCLGRRSRAHALIEPIACRFMDAFWHAGNSCCPRARSRVSIAVSKASGFMSALISAANSQSKANDRFCVFFLAPIGNFLFASRVAIERQLAANLRTFASRQKCALTDSLRFLRRRNESRAQFLQGAIFWSTPTRIGARAPSLLWLLQTAQELWRARG